MFRKALSLVGGLPAIGALAPVIWCLSFGLTHLIVGSAVGRQSSTSGLVTFFALLAAPVLGLTGFWLGKLAQSTFGPPVPAQATPILKSLSLVVVLAAIAVLASFKASTPILAAEHDAQPRVVVNSAQLHKRTASLPAEGLLQASRAYDYLEKTDIAIDWSEGVRFARKEDALEVQFLASGISMLIPVAGISYISSVDAIPVRMNATSRPMLALLITGRATGRRDLLAVISDSRELVYLEVLERSWNSRLNSLAISPSPAMDRLLVGSDPRNLLLYAPDDAI